MVFSHLIVFALFERIAYGLVRRRGGPTDEAPEIVALREQLATGDPAVRIGQNAGERLGQCCADERLRVLLLGQVPVDLVTAQPGEWSPRARKA